MLKKNSMIAEASAALQAAFTSKDSSTTEFEVISPNPSSSANIYSIILSKNSPKI